MIRAVMAALTIALLWPAAAAAHRLDEYLQAARVSLERTRVLVELDLTPGAALASTIVPLIDRDADGVISPAEIEAYGRSVLADVSVSVDGQGAALELTSIDAPSIAEMREGMATIRLRATGRVHARSGTHDLYVENRHLPSSSVYMVNALMPDDPAITVVSQIRDPRQSSARVEYDIGPGRGAQAAWLSIGAIGLSALAIFRRRP
jgi:hypothetical protein